MNRYTKWVTGLLLVMGMAAYAQEPLKILKVDPPNWYATLPRPMLLVRGEGLTGASFQLSDPALHVETRNVSPNGHWAQLWLSASPARPETVELQVRRGAERASAPYTFAAPRSSTDGLAGVSGADVMYMIMTDRFADGDLHNDGPLAQSAATSPEAAAERAKSRGWHGGDLRGIAQHADYLQQLGVTTIWPTPVYQNHNEQAYHGYSCTDYYAVDEHYGSLADLQELARTLHRRGMKLVLDTVPNHVGPRHPWVNDEPTPDWFHGTAAHHHGAEYDFKSLVDPHSSPEARVGTLTGWFADVLPDMNTDSPAVAEYLRQNAVWWLEQTGADGLRIDTFPYVNRGFWQSYDAELKTLFPRVTEVGEVEDGDPATTSFFAGGRRNTAGDGTFDTGLYTPFDYPVYYALRGVFSGTKPMSAIADVLRSDMLYPTPDRLVTVLGNHDQPRFLSLPGANPARLRMAYGLIGTLRGTPQVYYGDELAMTGGDDPDNRHDMPGGFPAATTSAGPGKEPDGFSSAGRTPDQRAMHDWVANVFALRRSAPALQFGYQQDLLADATGLAYLRGAQGTTGCVESPRADRYLVVLNIDKAARRAAIPATGNNLAGCGRFTPVLGTGTATVGPEATPATIQVEIPAESIAVFRVEP